VPEVLLTFHCAPVDAEIIAAAIRALSRAPLHIREETVRGRDFADATTTERVTGRLRRSTLELIVEEAAVASLVEAVGEAKRSLPVRWRTVSIAARGRIE
jgi:hypothetical protein